MRPSSTALATFLDGANYHSVQIDLYTFVLITGEVFRYTGGNVPLTVPAAGFPSGSVNAGANRTFALGPRFGRSKVTTRIGVEATELDIEVLAGASDLIGTLPFAEAVRVGLFDGATVELDRFFAPPRESGSGPLDTSLGCLLWFHGRVADCEVGRSAVRIKVKSLMNLLAIQQMPRRLYQASCGHVFGDAMCGYDRAQGLNAAGAPTGIGQGTVTAAAGTSQGFIICTAPVADHYIEGTILGATGANTGYSRTIAHTGDGSQIGLFKPFLFPVAVGDTFAVLPGCDHTTTGPNGCQARDNLARFGGFPYIPPPEAAA